LEESEPPPGSNRNRTKTLGKGVVTGRRR